MNSGSIRREVKVERPSRNKASKHVTSAKAGSISTLIAVINMLVGFVFQAVIAANLGLTETSDSFQLAWSFVTFGAVTIYTLVITFLIPKMQLPSTNDLSISIGAFPIALGLILSIAQIVVASTLTSGAVSTILYWSSPSILLAGLTATPQAIAYIQKRFVVASIGPIANGIGLLIIVFVWLNNLNPVVLGIAITTGYLTQLIVVSVPLIWKRPVLVWKKTTSIWLVLGITGFTLLSKSQPLIERVLSAETVDGATSALGYGQKVAQGLITVASFGLALTSMASLSSHISSNRIKEASHVFSRVLGATFLVTSVVVAFALPLSWVGSTVLYSRGSFSSSDAEYVADIISIQLLWVFSGSIAGVLTGYLYAKGDYWRVVGVAIIGIVGTVVSTLFLNQLSPMFAVAIGSSVGAILSLIWATVLVMKSEIWRSVKTEIRAQKFIYLFSLSLMSISLTCDCINRTIGTTHTLFGVIIGLLPLTVIATISIFLPKTRQRLLGVFDAKL